MNDPTFGALFAGIGGFEYGLVDAGWLQRWYSEIDPYCIEVHQHQWPDVQNLGDVKAIDWSTVEPVDLICGGFPCQDISRAGRRAGIDGEQSGLWSEFARAIRSLRPRFVFLENSNGLTVHGLDRITADLAACGYDAEWDCLPAAAFGAPHIRDRLYLVAYPSSGRHRAPDETVFAGWASSQLHGGWEAEPRVGRVADGLPHQMDRLRVLGNAVVPAVVEHIGLCIRSDFVAAVSGNTQEEQAE